MKVKIKKMHKNAVIPSYAKPGDAGMDLTVVSMTFDIDTNICTLDFGIAIEIPEGYVGLLFPRSSVYKKNCILSNSVGVIDSGYRGSIMAKFYEINSFCGYEEGEKALQLIIMPYPQIQFEEVEELSNTDRGAGGFGSTGA